MAVTVSGAWIGVSAVLWGLPPAILCHKTTFLFLCLFFSLPLPSHCLGLGGALLREEPWPGPAEGGREAAVGGAPGPRLCNITTHAPNE